MSTTGNDVCLAIFDLDNTLLAGDSDHAWGQFLVERGLVDPVAYREANDRFYADYQAGNLDIFAYLEFALQPLTQHSPEQLRQWHQEFMRTKVQPMLLDKAFTLLEKHRSQGHYLMIITATNSFVTGPIAERLGVDMLLATEPEKAGERYTGRVSGTPCFQDGKVTRLNAWLNSSGHSLAGSYFYSDSHNDIPLLELVDNPVAVDADEPLRELASQRGWPQISLR